MPDDEQDFVLGELPPRTVGLLSGSPESLPGDSAILGVQTANPGILTITRDGPCAIVSFNCLKTINTICVAGYRAQLFHMLQDPECKVVRFDLTGILVVPSGMLGLFVSIHKRGCEIELVNPSAHILETLTVTKLDAMVTIRSPTET